jgi:hypothetical protein
VPEASARFWQAPRARSAGGPRCEAGKPYTRLAAREHGAASDRRTADGRGDEELRVLALAAREAIEVLEQRLADPV